MRQCFADVTSREVAQASARTTGFNVHLCCVMHVRFQLNGIPLKAGCGIALAFKTGRARVQIER